MWEGPPYTPSAIEIQQDHLKAQLQSNTYELNRLRTLLDANSISWAELQPQPTASTKLKRLARSTRGRQTTINQWTKKLAREEGMMTEELPHLPNEILLRIMKEAVIHSSPIIDPFWKLLPENMTGQEQKQSSLNLGLLKTNKFFHNEGTKLFITSNQFIFTQPEALQNFANFSPESRATIDHVNLRIVAKYYDGTAYKKVLRGNCTYHALLESPTVWVKARPLSAPKDKGIQSYSWQQVVDCLQALIVYPRINSRSQRKLLFPNLKTLRLDCVNFSDHIPFIGSSLISILRWHVGQIVDELTVTGLVDEDMSNGEEQILHSLVKDNGIFAHGTPVFASAKIDRLKPLPGYDLNLIIPKSSTVPKRGYATLAASHPEGGQPPASLFPGGSTVWKYVAQSLAEPKKKWVEFHRRCGLPVDNCGELQTMLEEMKEDEDSMAESLHGADDDVYSSE